MPATRVVDFTSSALERVEVGSKIQAKCKKVKFFEKVNLNFFVLPVLDFTKLVEKSAGLDLEY